MAEHLKTLISALSESARINQIVDAETEQRRKHVSELLANKERLAEYVRETRLAAVAKAIVLFEAADSDILLSVTRGENLFSNHFFRTIHTPKLGADVVLMRHGEQSADQDYTLSLPIDTKAKAVESVTDLAYIEVSLAPSEAICSTRVSLDAQIGNPEINDALRVWRANDYFAAITDIAGLNNPDIPTDSLV